MGGNDCPGKVQKNDTENVMPVFVDVLVNVKDEYTVDHMVIDRRGLRSSVSRPFMRELLLSSWMLSSLLMKTASFSIHNLIRLLL